MSRSRPDPSLSTRAADPRIAKLQHLRHLSFWLDNAVGIPGTRYRVGLDPLLGLIPGGGDIAGLALSAYIVLEAARMGASKSTLGRMAYNIFLETLAGTVPLFGDLFDATWKSNVRNMRLLEDHLQFQRPAANNRWFAVLLILGLVLVLVSCAYLSFRLVQWFVQTVGQI